MFSLILVKWLLIMNYKYSMKISKLEDFINKYKHLG